MTTKPNFAMICRSGDEATIDAPIAYRLTPKAFAHFAVACRVRRLGELVSERLAALRGGAAPSHGSHPPTFTAAPPLAAFLAGLVKP